MSRVKTRDTCGKLYHKLEKETRFRSYWKSKRVVRFQDPLATVNEDVDHKEGVMSENEPYLRDLILSPTTPDLFVTKPWILTMIDRKSGQACEVTEGVD